MAFTIHGLTPRLGVTPSDRRAVAAYGDDGLWYVPTQDEYPRGGYEVGAGFCRDDVDAIMTAAIENLLEVAPAAAQR